MARSADALINPELLIWARDTSGLSFDDAAQKLKVSSERLTEWESGGVKPTVIQLRDIARVYRRPFAAFYLPAPPTTFRVPHDFRTLKDGDAAVTPSMRSELRRIAFQRQLATELVEPGESNPVNFLGSVNLSDEVETTALRARQILGVDLAEQTSWGGDYGSFNGWRSAFEELGVLIFQFEDVEVGDLRGFSIPEVIYPVIAVNGKDRPHGRVFTLFHEFVHLLINAPGLCDLHETDRPGTDNQRIERYCNAVAAAALLPREALLSSLNVERLRMRNDWPLADIQSTAAMFGTSREAVLLRLVSLGGTSFGFYRVMEEQFRKEYAEAKRRQKLRDKRQGRSGGLPQAMKAVRRVGPSFAQIVLRAYDREVITTSDLAEYLGVRVKHFPKVRTLAFSPHAEGAAS